MSVRCIQCSWLKPEDLTESVTVGDEIFYVCTICADNLSGPGKHEGVDESDRALCVVLESIAGDSGMDHWLTDDYQGYVGIVDRFMLIEDDRGFVDVRAFASPDAAMREINGYEDDGFGADQHDAWITDERGGYAVSFDGKYVDRFPRLNRAKAMVSLLMRDSGYYPNVFLSGEHGPSVRRIEVRDLAPLANGSEG